MQIYQSCLAAFFLQAKVVAPPMQPTNHVVYVGYVHFPSGIVQSIIKRPALKNAISKFAFWAASRKQRKIARTASSCIVMNMAVKKPPLLKIGKVHKTYDDLSPLTFQGQIGQAQNAILEIAFFSAGLLISVTYLSDDDSVALHKPQELLHHPNPVKWGHVFWIWM